MTTKYERVSAFIKFTHEDDSDLIQWFESIPLGERNHYLKSILRLGLRLPAKSKAAPDDKEVERLRAQLDEQDKTLRAMATALAALQQRIESGVTMKSTDQPASGVADRETLAKRQENLSKSSW